MRKIVLLNCITTVTPQHKFDTVIYTPLIDNGRHFHHGPLGCSDKSEIVAKIFYVATESWIVLLEMSRTNFSTAREKTKYRLRLIDI
jgi:hypothetical protein